MAIFGDIQGHATAFRDALAALGVDLDTGDVPDDLTVVQVGDLIHKGPDSEAVVALVARCLANSADHFVQLIGNHEGQYLGGPVFWPDLIADAAAVQLAEWFVDRQVAVAHSVEIAGSAALVTHGGLTPHKWDEIGRPESAADAAAILNDEFWSDPATALMPGLMLYGEVGPPGVAWPEPVKELYLPWMNHGATPFAQVHGHASPFSWKQGKFWRGVPRRIRKHMTVDTEARHTIVAIGGHDFIGVDTANGPTDGDLPIVPYVVTNNPGHRVDTGELDASVAAAAADEQE